MTLDDALYFDGDPLNQRLLILDDRNAATGFTAAGQVDTYTVSLNQAGPFRALLVWTDAPGSPLAAHALVNDDAV